MKQIKYLYIVINRETLTKKVMEAITINGADYRIGRSTWHPDYSSLFITRNGSTCELCVIREWEHIKDDVDARQALHILWPSQF